ncbi:MAG TPA: hypothetical protein VGJ26_13705 [Pirellulales bacterium]|jgi:hypothetical protein
MTSDARADSPLVFGFLTVVQQPSQGLVGGYLLLNAQARPLEFHCTAPVRASRTQEILYGPTLDPYLYGEQIGRTLFQACQQQPTAIFTDRPAALSAAEHSAAPVWLVLGETITRPTDPLAINAGSTTVARDTAGQANSGTPNAGEFPPPTLTLRTNSAHLAPANRHTLRCGAHRLVCRPEDAARGVEDRIDAALALFDLNEPFERIRAAIDESQRGGR